MSIDMPMTVDQLIALPFSRRSKENQIKIITDGRPKPVVKTTVKTEFEDVQKSERQFRSEAGFADRNLITFSQFTYDKYNWLTGSVTTGNYYCWPCLLFAPPGLWNKIGISDIAILAGAPEHEKTAEHIEAIFCLQTFIDQHLQIKKEKTVNKNVDALKLVADVICCLTGMHHPSTVSNYSSLLEVERCITVMQILRNYDSLNKSHTDSAISLTRKFPDVIKNMVHVLAKIMKMRIAEEIRSADYVSVILSQHSNVKIKAQISTFLRFVKDGKVCERFIGFTHEFIHASVSSIYNHIMNVIEEFEINFKCIAVSLDGGILSGDEMCDLIEKLKANLHNCSFMPCCYHFPDSVIQKSLCTFNECKYFFKTMSALEEYFCENSEILRAFYDFAVEDRPLDVPNILRCEGNLHVSSKFVAYVKNYRQIFVNFFNHMIENSSKWDSCVITKAVGFRNYLQDLLATFFLNIFSKIFAILSPLNSVLTSNMAERELGGKMVYYQLLKEFHRLLFQDFDSLWSATAEEFSVEAPDIKGHKYFSFFNNIVQKVRKEIEIRYRILERIEFCNLFDITSNEWDQESPKRVENFLKFYPKEFSQTKILNEMEEFFRNGGLKEMSLYSFHFHLYECNFKKSLPSLYKISQFLLAMPLFRAVPDTEITMLHKIGKWTFGPDDNPMSHDLSIICVECDFLQEMKQSANFYNAVLANFPHHLINLPN